MSTKLIWNLALATGVAATLVGCAQVSPNSSQAPTPELPLLQAPPAGGVAPDQLVFGDRQILVNGPEINVEQIRKQLPAQITAAEASKLLVKIDPRQIVQEGSGFETQQRFGRGFGRGFYGGVRRGFGWSGALGRWGGWGGGWGGWGAYGGWGGLGWYPYGNLYFPYAYSAGCWSPAIFPVASALYSPFLYGYGGGFYPYTFGCGF